MNTYEVERYIFSVGTPVIDSVERVLKYRWPSTVYGAVTNKLILALLRSVYIVIETLTAVEFTFDFVGSLDIWCTYKHLRFETILKHPIRGICVTCCEIYRRRG